MANWQVWLTLSLMLFVGRLFRVGCFLAQFSLAALITGLAAFVITAFEGELQLQVFLLLSLLFMLNTYLFRRAESTRGN